MRTIFIRFLLVSIFFAVIIYSFFGEKITIGNGAGWDGIIYKNICENFLSLFSKNKIDSYTFQRVLPFAIINIIVEIFDLNKNIQTIIFLMCILNTLALTVANFFFFSISIELKFKQTTEVIAYCSIFFNYPILKMMGYYPLLTDYFSFSVGIGLFYFFIKKNTFALVILSILGAFIWPTILLQGLLLAFFPREKIEIDNKLIKTEKNTYNYIISYCFIFVPILCYILITSSHIFINKFKTTLHRDVTNNDFLIVSMISSATYLFIIFKSLYVDIFEQIKLFFKQLKFYNILKLIICFSLVKLIILIFSSNNSRHNLASLLYEIMAESLQAPFSNIVNLFTYYGFGIIFLVILWKDFIHYVKNSGFGYLSIISMAFVLSLGNESRYLINFIPFVFIPVLISFNKFKIGTGILIIYTVLTLILSRFWFLININGRISWDRYMLSQGPWQPFSSYLVFLLLFIFCLLVFLIFSKRIMLKNFKK